MQMVTSIIIFNRLRTRSALNAIPWKMKWFADRRQIWLSTTGKLSFWKNFMINCDLLWNDREVLANGRRSIGRVCVRPDRAVVGCSRRHVMMEPWTKKIGDPVANQAWPASEAAAAKEANCFASSATATAAAIVGRNTWRVMPIRLVVSHRSICNRSAERRPRDATRSVQRILVVSASVAGTRCAQPADFCRSAEHVDRTRCSSAHDANERADWRHCWAQQTWRAVAAAGAAFGAPTAPQSDTRERWRRTVSSRPWTLTESKWPFWVRCDAPSASSWFDCWDLRPNSANFCDHKRRLIECKSCSKRKRNRVWIKRRKIKLQIESEMQSKPINLTFVRISQCFSIRLVWTNANHMLQFQCRLCRKRVTGRPNKFRLNPQSVWFTLQRPGLFPIELNQNRMKQSK